MGLARQTMTDEQRKSVAIEYLKAFDNGGVTSSGGSILELFSFRADSRRFAGWADAGSPSRFTHSHRCCIRRLERTPRWSAGHTTAWCG